ncbi:hypothetical protein BGZ47_005468, partial [Haplosporangium gracile]
SLKRFFAVLEPGPNASKYQSEDFSQQQQQQQQQQTQQNVFSQDKKSPTGEIIPPSSTTATNSPPVKKQPDASYLLKPDKLSTTQAFYMSQNIIGDMS